MKEFIKIIFGLVGTISIFMLFRELFLSGINNKLDKIIEMLEERED